MLTQIIEKGKVLKKKVFIAFIDLRKAFDRVYRVGQWELYIRDLYVRPKTINLLKDMYFHTLKKVEVNNELTDWLNSEIGVRQGCVLSSSFLQCIFSNLELYWKRVN